MGPHAFVPFILNMAAAATTAWLGYRALRRRSSAGQVEFGLLMTAVAFFAAACAGEIAASTITGKILWSKISYAGLVCIPPLWLMFTLRYTHRSAQLTRLRLVLLWLVPPPMLALVATNEWHRLVWPTFTPVFTASGFRLVYGHGWLLWAYALLYVYPLLFIGSALLMRSAWSSPRLYRRQAVLIVAGALAPWIGNLFYLLDVNPWPGLDLTPLTLAASGVFLAVSVFRYHAFDITPIAREAVFNSIGDAVLVVDTHNRLVDLNPAARRLAGLGSLPIGSNPWEALTLSEAALRLKDEIETHTVLEFGSGERARVFDISISPLRDGRGRLQGRTLVLHDITGERALLEAEGRRSRRMVLLHAITQSALSMPGFDSMMQLLADSLGGLFDADGAFITLWDEANQRTIPYAAYGTMRQQYRELKIEPGELTLTQSVLEAGRVLVIEDASNTPYMSPRIAAQFPTRSILALPLFVDGRRLGAILVAFNQPRHLTADEIALGELVAGQVAIAIAKVQLHEAETRRAAQLTALQSISQAVVSSLDLRQIFETVVNVLHRSFRYRYVSIYQLHNEVLYLGAQAGYEEGQAPPEVPINQGVIGRAVRTRQPQLVRDARTDPDFLYVVGDAQSLVCVPLMQGNRVLGTLDIEEPGPNALSEADLVQMVTFGSQVVVAINNANLFEAEREQRRLAEALREMGMALSESLDFEVVLDSLLDQIGKVVPYDAASVLLADKVNGTARVVRQRGAISFDTASDPAQPLVYEISAAANLARMAETGQPLIIADSATHPAYANTPTTAHMRSWAGAPISLHGQVIGFLSLDKNQPGYYQARHASSLAAFAGQAAIAIENAGLYARQLRRAMLDELTGVYNRRGLFEYGQNELDRALRLKQPLSALFIDIDHFKLFNDRYSYAVGDQVLRQFAGCVRSQLREPDVIGRYGGEEFTILLPETALPAAARVAERIRRAVQDLQVETSQGHTNLTVSIGVSESTPRMTTLDELLDRAGQALHQAKNAGRNCVSTGE